MDIVLNLRTSAKKFDKALLCVIKRGKLEKHEEKSICQILELIKENILYVEEELAKRIEND